MTSRGSPQVWKQLRPGWRSPKHTQLWLSSLERYAVPRIGKMPISEVTSADVIGILAPIWHDMPPTARKLRQRIRAVMEWAVAMGLGPGNPCDRIGPVLGSQGDVVRHMRAVPHGFRSSFRDWAAEETDHPREVIEAALAHVVQNKVEAAYMRSDLFERRRRLVNDWAAYLAGRSRKPRVATRRHGTSG